VEREALYLMNDLMRQCGAETSAGTPCKRAPIIGGTRCILHGGGTPEAKRAANEALLGARLASARVLFDIVNSYERDAERTPCATCGFTPKGDLNPIIRAAVAVLDRTGFGPHMTVDVAPAEPLDAVPIDQVIVRLEKLLAVAYDIRDAEQRQLQAGVLDADVVVDEDDTGENDDA
jgi:hypothetical protein